MAAGKPREGSKSPKRKPPQYSPSQKRLLRLFGARVHHLRNERGMTQRELADACKAYGAGSRATLQKIESGRSAPTLPLIFALSKSLGTSMAALVEVDLERPKKPTNKTA